MAVQPLAHWAIVVTRRRGIGFGRFEVNGGLTMIGGVDIEIPTRAALDASVRVIRSHWPKAVF